MNVLSKNLAIQEWVDHAPANQSEFRKAVHIILCGIAHKSELRSRMIMKGGILLALRYRSSRFTKDIDFSTSLTKAELEPERIRDLLAAALPIAGEMLDYGVDCRIQKFELLPPHDRATFPSIRMRIGYATMATAKHKRLLAGSCPDVISIDFSLNEPVPGVEPVSLTEDAVETILVYTSADLIAEKIRALLQQVDRNRYRRQDIYDLQFLLLNHPPDAAQKVAILESLNQKAASRSLAIDPDSMKSEEVQRRAKFDYDTLADEIEGPLPDFNGSYKIVEAFYRQLPWPA